MGFVDMKLFEEAEGLLEAAHRLGFDESGMEKESEKYAYDGMAYFREGMEGVTDALGVLEEGLYLAVGRGKRTDREILEEAYKTCRDAFARNDIQRVVKACDAVVDGLDDLIGLLVR